MQSTGPLKKAWLVTWESLDDHARVDEERKVVAVLNYRWGGEKVRELVEQLYIAFEYGPWDKVRVARSKRCNPSLARFGTVNGTPWYGEVICGQDPWLRARLVRNVQVVIKDDGTQLTRWHDVPRPKAI